MYALTIARQNALSQQLTALHSVILLLTTSDFEGAPPRAKPRPLPTCLNICDWAAEGCSQRVTATLARATQSCPPEAHPKRTDDKTVQQVHRPQQSFLSRCAGTTQCLQIACLHPPQAQALLLSWNALPGDNVVLIQPPHL